MEVENEAIILSAMGKISELRFDSKVSLLNWLKDNLSKYLIHTQYYIDAEKKDSVKITMEEKYMNSLARRETIMSSISNITTQLPKYVIGCIIATTVCSSLLLSFYQMLETTSPYIRLSWRSLINMFLFAPLLGYEYYKNQLIRDKMTDGKNLATLLLCIFFAAMGSLCQVVALQYTFISHVFLFSGMVSIVLLFWKLIKRLPVSPIEIAGILVAIIGAVTISQSGDMINKVGGANYVYIGDLIAFLSSVFGAFNLQILPVLLKTYSEGTFLMIYNLTCYIIAFLALFLYGHPFEFSTNPQIGLFGFFTLKYLYCILYFFI